jgi:predicted TIM-barrel fold metal-dependent hydrolase
MLGSDLPIENLRSEFGRLYDAYDAIFAGLSEDDRAWLFHRTAEHWYAGGPSGPA